MERPTEIFVYMCKLYDCNHMTFLKMQNYGDVKRSVISKEQVEHREHLGQLTYSV